MRILITNDDGYESKGIEALARVARQFGQILVVAPKTVQSGMSMAVTMGYKPIAARKVYTLPGEEWWYLDGTPSSCVKFGLDNVMYPEKPDLVLSGINHGSNAATAALYSGTVGAAMEAALNGIPAIAVSLDDFRSDADFSAIEQLLPGLLTKLLKNFNPRPGSIYNINFPAIPASQIIGVRATRMGMAHWEHEYLPYGPEFLFERGHVPSKSDVEYVENKHPFEELVVMAGDFVDDEKGNGDLADHLLMEQGYIVVTPLNIDHTDTSELQRLCDII